MRCILNWRGATSRLSALLLIGLLAGGALACAPTEATAPTTATPTLAPGSAGRIAPAAQMTVQRACHTATRLRDGKVLVVGGFKVEGLFLASAELYDPATHAFVETGHTAVAHTCHSTTLLPDGKVLVMGGNYDQPQQTAELYDPATGRFSPATGMPPELRDGFSATLLATGEVLLAGGYSVHGGYAARGDILESAVLYNPTAHTFRPAGRMTTARAGQTATLLEDGSVLFTGGFTSQGVTASAEIYDPATGAFAPTGQMTAKRHKHAAVRLEDGQVLIVGGSDERDYEGRYASMELYNPTSGAFSETVPMQAARYKIGDTVTVLADGEVLIAGDGAQAELYDPGARTVRPVAGLMGASRFSATATLLVDGQVLIAGGYDGAVRTTERTWLFVP
jgi:Kelch motif/Galactose oxidase, central domain